MASHVQGIAIVIKAFLPTGKTLDEQFEALSIVKDAHASGDYSKVLAKAKIDEVKAEQKTRRVEDQPQTQEEPGNADDGGEIAGQDQPTETTGDRAADEPTDEGVPEFLKKGKGKTA